MTRLKNRMNLYLTMLAAALLLAAPAGHAQVVGAPLGSVTLNTNCGFVSTASHSVGIGITFDGSNLWYSCYDSKLSNDPNHYDLIKANPKNGAMIAAYDIAGGMGAIAYDASRNVIWAGEGGGVSTNVGKIIKIPLDNNKNATPGTYTVAFSVSDAYNSPPSREDIVDGLAIDTSTDILYVHYDFATEIAEYNASTGAFLGFIPQAAGIPAGTIVMKNPPTSSCVVSGLAIGGNTLIEAADYCDHVWAVDKTTLIDEYDFSIAGSVTQYFDEKSLTCDTVTFPGSDALWVKDAFTPAAFAFALPPGNCGVGGGSGLASALNVSPTSLSFGKVTVNTASPPQTVTVTNMATSSVSISGVQTSGSFLVAANGCGSSLGAGLTCSVSVEFAPTSPGVTKGTLTIGADGTTLSVSLSGQGSKR